MPCDARRIERIGAHGASPDANTACRYPWPGIDKQGHCTGEGVLREQLQGDALAYVSHPVIHSARNDNVGARCFERELQVEGDNGLILDEENRVTIERNARAAPSGWLLPACDMDLQDTPADVAAALRRRTTVAEIGESRAI